MHGPIERGHYVNDVPRAMDACDAKHPELPEDLRDPTRSPKDLIEYVLLIRSLAMDLQLVVHVERHWSGSSRTETRD